jgi:hypothetical protein
MRSIIIGIIIFDPMKAILSCMLFFSFLLSSGQLPADTLPETKDGSGFDAEAIEASINKRKLQFNLEFGTTFGASRYGSYFGTYVAPHLSYPISKKFSINAGAYLSGISPVSQGDNPMVYGYPYGGLYSRSFVYVEGAYRLNDNLTLTGAVYKEVNLFNHGPAYPGYNPDVRGMIMGVDYRIGDHVFFRGEVEVSNGLSPFYHDPFMNPGGRNMQNPFFNRP